MSPRTLPSASVDAHQIEPLFFKDQAGYSGPHLACADQEYADGVAHVKGLMHFTSHISDALHLRGGRRGRSDEREATVDGSRVCLKRWSRRERAPSFAARAPSFAAQGMRGAPR